MQWTSLTHTKISDRLLLFQTPPQSGEVNKCLGKRSTRTAGNNKVSKRRRVIDSDSDADMRSGCWFIPFYAYYIYDDVLISSYASLSHFDSYTFRSGTDLISLLILLLLFLLLG